MKFQFTDKNYQVLFIADAQNDIDEVLLDIINRLKQKENSGKDIVLVLNKVKFFIVFEISKKFLRKVRLMLCHQRDWLQLKKNFYLMEFSQKISLLRLLGEPELWTYGTFLC